MYVPWRMHVIQSAQQAVHCTEVHCTAPAVVLLDMQQVADGVALRLASPPTLHAGQAPLAESCCNAVLLLLQRLLELLLYPCHCILILQLGQLSLQAGGESVVLTANSILQGDGTNNSISCHSSKLDIAVDGPMR